MHEVFAQECLLHNDDISTLRWLKKGKEKDEKKCDH